MASSREPNGQPHNEGGRYLERLLFWAFRGVVSIGPYHDIDTNLKCRDLKLQYQYAFAARYGLNEDHFHDVESTLGETARFYYLGSPKQSLKDLEGMMVVDGVFLLELMLRSRFPEYREAGDDEPIFNTTRIIVDVCRDILLIENQLPLIFLEELYQLFVVPNLRPDEKDVSLAQLASDFFNAHLFGNNNIIGLDETQIDRYSKAPLVAFVRSFYSPRRNNDNDAKITVELIPPSVTILSEAGVKFEKVTSTSSRLSIVFDRGNLIELVFS